MLSDSRTVLPAHVKSEAPNTVVEMYRANKTVTDSGNVVSFHIDSDVLQQKRIGTPHADATADVSDSLLITLVFLSALARLTRHNRRGREQSGNITSG